MTETLEQDPCLHQPEEAAPTPIPLRPLTLRYASAKTRTSSTNSPIQPPPGSAPSTTRGSSLQASIPPPSGYKRFSTSTIASTSSRNVIVAAPVGSPYSSPVIPSPHTPSVPSIVPPLRSPGLSINTLGPSSSALLSKPPPSSLFATVIGQQEQLERAASWRPRQLVMADPMSVSCTSSNAEKASCVTIPPSLLPPYLAPPRRTVRRATLLPEPTTGSNFRTPFTARGRTQRSGSARSRSSSRSVAAPREAYVRTLSTSSSRDHVAYYLHRPLHGYNCYETLNEINAYHKTKIFLSGGVMHHGWRTDPSSQSPQRAHRRSATVGASARRSSASTAGAASDAASKEKSNLYDRLYRSMPAHQRVNGKQNQDRTAMLKEALLRRSSSLATMWKN